MKMKKKHNNLFAISILLLIILNFCLIFTACDKEKVEVQQNPNLYINSFVYDDNTKTMTAILTLSGEEKDMISDVVVVPEEFQSKIDFWYNKYELQYKLPSNAIYSSLEKKLTDKDRIVDGVQYTNLKVVFRYDTIYESIKSNGELKHTDDVYIHILPLKKDKMVEVFHLEKPYPNSANWYTILIATALTVAIIIVVISIIVKSKRKKCPEN